MCDLGRQCRQNRGRVDWPSEVTVRLSSLERVPFLQRNFRTRFVCRTPVYTSDCNVALEKLRGHHHSLLAWSVLLWSARLWLLQATGCYKSWPFFIFGLRLVDPLGVKKPPSAFQLGPVGRERACRKLVFLDFRCLNIVCCRRL